MWRANNHEAYLGLLRVRPHHVEVPPRAAHEGQAHISRRVIDKHFEPEPSFLEMNGIL